jgi:hypothetical protein
MSKMYDDFKDFLSIHYLTRRDDSEFWKVAKSGKFLTERNKEYLEMQKSKIISPNDVDQYYGYVGAALYNWVMTGLGFIDKNLAEKELDFYQQHDLGKAVWEINYNSFIDRKADIIDNTDFTMNIKEYASGNRFSK